ncbi:MAG: nucleotidyltransferase domain-containing protein [Candidatus Aminicenantes bacterium]
MTIIKSLISSNIRIAILKILVINPQDSFNINELSRMTGFALRGVDKELKNLQSGGILKKRIVGNQHRYQLNPLCPVYSEIKAIIVKTVGIANIIKEALNPLRKKIDYAFIFGSFASGDFGSESDVDLFIVSDLSGLKLTKALSKAQDTLGRSINIAHFKGDEFNRRKKRKDHFISKAISGPIINIIGKVDGS